MRANQHASCRGCAAVALVATAILAALDASGVRANQTKPKGPAKKQPPKIEIEFEETDWDAVEGSVARIDLERDTDLDLPAAKVLEVARDPKTQKVRSLKIQVGSRPAGVIPFAAVKRIQVKDEVVYESAKGRKESEEKAAWIARAKKNGVAPWEELTAKQHAEAVEQHKEFMSGVQKAFTELRPHETNEFLFYTNLADSKVSPFVKQLDAMHDALCKMYGIKKGTPVWKGKCLVIIFVTADEWNRFRKEFQNRPPASPEVRAACAASPAGQVVVSGFCGESPGADFAAHLVHETSHGFIHRWRTPVRPPSWVNEGMADLTATVLVPSAKNILNPEILAVAEMRRTRRLSESFFEPAGNIKGIQYGTALGMNRLLAKRNPNAYVAFINGIKEGIPWRESLKQSFQLTTDQLVTAYGQSIGVPDLKE